VKPSGSCLASSMHNAENSRTSSGTLTVTASTACNRGNGDRMIARISHAMTSPRTINDTASSRAMNPVGRLAMRARE
jgi:hypothetical protein